MGMFPFFFESLLGSNTKPLPEWHDINLVHLKTPDYDGEVPPS
jgi:hypothetical protein